MNGDQIIEMRVRLMEWLDTELTALCPPEEEWSEERDGIVSELFEITGTNILHEALAAEIWEVIREQEMGFLDPEVLKMMKMGYQVVSDETPDRLNDYLDELVQIFFALTRIAGY